MIYLLFVRPFQKDALFRKESDEDDVVRDELSEMVKIKVAPIASTDEELFGPGKRRPSISKR